MKDCEHIGRHYTRAKCGTLYVSCNLIEGVVRGLGFFPAERCLACSEVLTDQHVARHVRCHLTRQLVVEKSFNRFASVDLLIETMLEHMERELVAQALVRSAEPENHDGVSVHEAERLARKYDLATLEVE